MKPLSKIKASVMQLVSQGWSPEKVSLGITLGLLLGVFPVLASTTVLCLIVARILKLNQILVQTINQMVYPLQLLLLIPFIQMGRVILGQGQSSITVSSFMTKSSWGNPEFYVNVVMQQLYGVFVWMLLFIPIMALVYPLTLKSIRVWVK